MTNSNSEIAAIESPCIGVCRLDASGLCIGCLRSGEEIAAWPRMQPDEQRQLLDRLAQRKES